MKFLNKYLIILLLILSQGICAQVKFEALVSSESIGLNENVQVDFTMNAQGDNFQPPSFDGFDIVGGPNQSVNRSWINGKTSFSLTFSYFLSPKRKGKLNIGSAKIKINDELYQTDPISITVTEPVKRQSRGNNNGDFVEEDILNGINVVTEVSNKNPYINEPITVTHKLYVSIKSSVRGLSESKSPKYNKFWANIQEIKELNIQSGVYKGEECRYVVLRKAVLVPQESGDLQIDPLVLDIETEIPTGRRSFFGYPEMRSLRKEFSSGSVKIKVKPLPEEGKPEDFSGAVGKFSFKVTPSTTELKAGEPMELNVNVSGNGNLNLFSLPEPIVPSTLEVYTPISSENISPGAKGLQGKKTDKYTIIPQYKGQYAIKPLHFNYFDLDTKTYVTITSESIPIDVLDGPVLPTHKETVQETPIVTNTDFEEIKTVSDFKTLDKKDFIGSSLFYVLLSTPLFLSVFFLIGINKKRKNDISRNSKRNQSKRLAKKYLGEAKNNLTNKEVFYEALERCLHNFLKAKFNIETTEMNNDNIEELLAGKNISQSAISDFMDLKKACEFARYTPIEQKDMTDNYNRAIEVLLELEKQLK